jgi:hypothetical protein
MGLDVYFRRDIANVLRSTACASESAHRTAHEREIVFQTLVAVGLAFGLEPRGVPATIEPGKPPPLALVSWTEAARE